MGAHEPSETLPTLAELRARLAPGAGAYPPGTISHRVSRHPLSFVGADVQELLTAHHTGIAAILATHRDLAWSPVRRVQQTRALQAELEYGSPERAELAARRLWDVHARLTVRDPRGTPVSATDPDLLSLILVMGHLSGATWHLLMTTSLSGRPLTDGADALFAAMWPEREAYRAGVGIPAGFLPDDPGEAVAWAMDLVAENWTDGADARRVAGTSLGLARAYVAERFPRPWQRGMRLAAAALEQAVVATAALSLRGPLARRREEVTRGRSVPAGITAARGIRAAAALLPDRVLRDLTDAPTEG